MGHQLDQQTFWLIGASEGIGKAIAEALLEQGAKVIISARSADKLQALAAPWGERAMAVALDVTEEQAIAKAHELILKQWGEVDTAIFLTAAYQPAGLNDIDLAHVEQALDVNLMAAFRFIQALYPHFSQRQSGKLVLTGSLSAYCGLPKSQPYGATKAAIHHLAESLYLEAKQYHVQVQLISPGFVNTRLTQKNDFEMPNLMEPEEAAQHILHGLNTQTFEIRFPVALWAKLALLRKLPRRWSLAVVGKFVK